MHDFIEKPSRMILIIIGLIALVTIIILLSRSSILGTGGQSLVDANGNKIAALTPTVLPGNGNGDKESDDHQNVTDDGGEQDYDEDDWAEEDDADQYGEYDTEEVPSEEGDDGQTADTDYDEGEDYEDYQEEADYEDDAEGETPD